MADLRLIVSGANAEAIQRAVGKIRAFLDSVGAKYRFHDSGKSDSAYFHVKEPARVAEDPWNPDVVDTRVSDHTLPQVYDPPDLDVSVPRPRPKAVSPDFAVKLLKDFMKGKIDIDDGEVIPVDSSLKEHTVFGLHRKALYPLSSSFQRILSAFSSGEGVDLGDLADLLNATQADIHFMHFYAGGQDGKWDEIHNICSDYYIRLGDAYDDVAELCLQLDQDISHPNDSASAVGFNNLSGSLGATFQYDEVMGILQDRIRNLVDTAAKVASRYQGRDPDSTAVRKYLEDFIAEWSKEAGYRLQGRLNGLLDFGGTYRDRVTDEQLGDQGSGRGLIAGDVEEPVF
jgi:DNA-binding ferritin-like protein